MKISIIVTCYNIEDYIEQCIDSIKNQTFSEFEAFIIDDGSKDHSKEKIQKSIQKDKRFHYIYKENGGVSSARNLGLKHATGEYICFIDGDDYVEKDYLEVLYEAVKKEDSDFSICNIKRLYQDKISYNKVDETAVKQCKYPALWNKLCKRELFDKYHIRFIENVWYEDLAVGAQIYLIAKKYQVTDANIYNYIQRDNSLVRVYDDRIFDIYKITEEIEQFAKKNKVYKEKYDTIEFISIYHILIGTIYRASFHQNFRIKMIKEIVKKVKEKYPNWHKNPWIKTLPMVYRIYLIALRFHLYFVIYLLLKLFGKKLRL